MVAGSAQGRRGWPTTHSSVATAKAARPCVTLRLKKEAVNQLPQGRQVTRMLRLGCWRCLGTPEAHFLQQMVMGRHLEK